MYKSKQHFCGATVKFLGPLLLLGLVLTQPATGQVGLDAPERSTQSTPSDKTEEDKLKELQSRIKRIEDISLSINPKGDTFPIDHSHLVFPKRTDANADRSWALMEYNWSPSELIFQPPYWEQTPLERYGQTLSPTFQPILSGAHFFATFPIIPYKIGIDRTHDHISTLGYYRPGSPMPCVKQRLPFEWDATLIQAGAMTGALFIIP